MFSTGYQCLSLDNLILLAWNIYPFNSTFSSSPWYLLYVQVFRENTGVNIVLVHPWYHLFPAHPTFLKAPVPGYGKCISFLLCLAIYSSFLTTHLLLTLAHFLSSANSVLFLFHKLYFSFMFIFMAIFHGSPSHSDICPIFISVIFKTLWYIFYNLIVLVLAEIELIFFIVAGMMPCFRFRMRALLLTHWYLSCRAVHTHSQKLFNSSHCSASKELGRHKELRGDETQIWCCLWTDWASASGDDYLSHQRSISKSLHAALLSIFCPYGCCLKMVLPDI